MRSTVFGVGLSLVLSSIGFAAPANKPAPVANPASAPEEAGPAPSATVPSDFPCTLQSVFGRPGGVLSAGLRDKASGRSLWLSPGEKVGEYTLRTVDTKSGTVVFSRGAQSFRMRLSGATPATGPAPVARKPVDPVENLRVEKGLLTSGRMIASAANQYFAENAVREAEFGKLRTFFGKDAFPPGTKIEVKSGDAVQIVDIGDKSVDKLVLKAGDTFALQHEGYDKTASGSLIHFHGGGSTGRPSEMAGGDSGFVFSVDSAAVMRRGATP